MGSWGRRFFENDAALDLLGALEKTTNPDQQTTELRRAFDSYQSYEERRLAGKNFMVITESNMRKDLLASRCSAEDTEYLLQRMSSSFGKTIEDLGDFAAQQAIAAAEVVLCKLTGDLSKLPEDIEFIEAARIVPDQALAQSAKQTIEALLLNKPLAKAYGASWRKAVKHLLSRLAGFAP